MSTSVQFECVARKVYESSPWTGDTEAAEVIRLAVLATDHVPPRILSAAEVQAANCTKRCLLSNRPSCPVRAGNWHWTAMDKSPTDLQTAQWRMTTALRLGLTPHAGPRDICEHSLAKHPYHSFCCAFGGARARPHRAIPCTLHRLLSQRRRYADKERHVSGLHDWVKPKPDAELVLRCAVMDVVSWFLAVMQQLWMDVSVRCPHAEIDNEGASKRGGGCSCWGSAENEALWYGRAIVGLRDLWKTGRRGHQVAA